MNENIQDPGKFSMQLCFLSRRCVGLELQSIKSGSAADNALPSRLASEF